MSQREEVSAWTISLRSVLNPFTMEEQREKEWKGWRERERKEES